MRRIPDEILIEKFKEKTNALGRVPTKEDINTDPDMPHSWTYCQRFGGLSQLAKRLGLPPNRFYDVSLEECIQLGKKLYQETGIAPTVADFDKRTDTPHSYYVRSVYQLTWNEFLILCDIPTYTRGESWIKNRKAELLVKSKLLEGGYQVKDLSETSTGATYSFLVDEKWKICIRYSSYIRDNQGRSIYWKFRLHLENKNPVPDYYIGVGYDDAESPRAFFLFPVKDLMVLKSISINPFAMDRSKYGQYLAEGRLVL